MANPMMYGNKYQPEGVLGAALFGRQTVDVDQANEANLLDQMIRNSQGMQTYEHNTVMNPLLQEQQGLANRTATPAALMADILSQDQAGLQLGVDATKAGYDKTILDRDLTEATQPGKIASTNASNFLAANEDELANVSSVLGFADQFQTPEEQIEAIQFGLSRVGIGEDSPVYSTIKQMTLAGRKPKDILKVFGTAGSQAARRKPEHIRDMDKLREQTAAQIRVATGRATAADYRMILDSEQKYYKELQDAYEKHDTDIVKKSMRPEEWQSVKERLEAELARLKTQMATSRVGLRKSLDLPVKPEDLIEAGIEEAPNVRRTMGGASNTGTNASASSKEKTSGKAAEPDETGLMVTPGGVKFRVVNTQ